MTIKDLERLANGAEAFDVEDVFKAPLHYRQVVAVQRHDSIDLYLSGVVGFRDKPVIEGTGAFEQAMQTIDNIKSIIDQAAQYYGVKTDNPLGFVVKTEAYVINSATNSKEVNRAYQESGMPKVGRAMIGAAELPLKALVEITATAVLPRSRDTFSM